MKGVWVFEMELWHWRFVSLLVVWIVFLATKDQFFGFAAILFAADMLLGTEADPDD